MTQAPYIVLAAGGTGGHMMPAEAVADILAGKGCDVSLVTDKRGAAIGNALAGVEKSILSASSHMTGGIAGKIKAVLSILGSTSQVRKQFKRRRPSVVMGFGGYPSMPAVLAARSLGIPYMLHEQNAVLGRVNRFAAKKAACVALSVKDTQRVPEGTKTVVTGNPVRAAIVQLAEVAYTPPASSGPIRIFILGGSQGARILSDVVPAAVADLTAAYGPRLEVAHQARAEDVERVKAAYAAAAIQADVQPYFDDVGSILARTHLVICRSGASTLAELTAMGRPAILVPLAIAADNHQSANARIIEQAGGGLVMEETEFTAAALSEKLAALFGNTEELRTWSDGMRSAARLDAAQMLAHTVLDVCESKGVKE